MKYEYSDNITGQEIEDFVQGGMKHLENNNLVDFYNYLFENCNSFNSDYDIIGAVTCYLEECGIDTAGELVRVTEALPSGYAYGTKPGWIMDNDYLMLPKGLKEIDDYAFSSTFGYKSVILNNISWLGSSVFEYSTLFVMYLDEHTTDYFVRSLKQDDVLDRFCFSHLRYVYVPYICKDKVPDLKFLFKDLHKRDGSNFDEVVIKVY